MSCAEANVGPPPGFEDVEQEQRPAPPEVLPEPSFGARTSPDTSCHVPQGEWNFQSRDVGQQDSTRDEWKSSDWSNGDTWHNTSWGKAWDSAKGEDSGAAWGRRASWESTTAGAARSGEGGRDKRDDDPWETGGDPWSSVRRDGALRGDRHERHGRPRADGREGRDPDSDYPDHRRQWWDSGSDDTGRRGQWSDDRASFSSGGIEDHGIAWNGWNYFGGGGGFKGASHEGHHSSKGGQGRPSERLSVPTFTGDDAEDLGGSARSYLRQIEAWRRMTLLPLEQQALVLYQNLGGKAWVAAEELSVAKLGSAGGVQYYVSWITARFLDLEVARIGKAFSDFFRRLRRKSGQSIREYNTEYDRLYARLREVGCQLPEDCAAWLYIDRLQLEEAQELNLLASVGNQYSLHKLQQAAVLHDRGHRKPWEQGSRNRKPHSAHVTDHDDPGLSESDDDGDLDGLPEEVAQAYLTYQTAKNKYKDQAKTRGYNAAPKDDSGDRDNRRGNDTAARDERLRKLKSKSFCASCGQKGHWHKDSECPNNKSNAGNSDKNVRAVEVCHHVPIEVMTLKHDGEALVGITDTACAKSVAGTSWLQRYSDLADEVGEKVDLVKEFEYDAGGVERWIGKGHGLECGGRTEVEDHRMQIDATKTAEEEIVDLERRLTELKKAGDAESGEPRPFSGINGHGRMDAVSIFPGHSGPGHRDTGEQLYDHDGCQFGNKPTVNKRRCCGGQCHERDSEAFITDGDFVKGHYNQKSIYVAHNDPTEACERPHLQRALREGDYRFETINKVLEETKMKAQKNTKGK
ncbi:GIP, partial [Symbiodinium necroappetens]